MVSTLGYLQKLKIKGEFTFQNNNPFTAKRKEEFICYGHPVFKNHFK